ncbi:MAG: hypothetical protein ACR2H3_12700 [Acidimicrobiales bacterium]
MNDLLLRAYVNDLVDRMNRCDEADRPRARNDRGEGVISAAIAVLIMAFLGVVVWVGFRASLDNTQEKVDDQIQEIGR